MKTQILRLEPHDDIISARDKMGWGQTGRVLLVWPKHGRVLARQLDLVLVQRHAHTLGVQLGLVTTDREVKSNARECGIPVFRDLNKAQRSTWRVPRRRRRPTLRPATPEFLRLENPETTSDERTPDPSTLRRLPAPSPELSTPIRLGLFILGICAMLSIAAILLPGARISLSPQTKPQYQSLAIKASSEVTAPSISGAIPARLLKVVVEGRDSLRSSGTTSLPDQPASGDLLFTNLTDQPISISKGTVVRTLGKNLARFTTVRAANIPAGPGQTVILNAKALTLGTAGNLPAGSLVAIEGPLGPNLTVTNPRATTGGSNRAIPAPTGLDYEQLATRLKTSLTQTALTELQSQLKTGDLLLTSVPSLTKVIEETFQPAEIQPADQLQLSLRLEFQALAAAEEDLNAMAAAILDANLPSGYLAVPGTLKVENLTDPVMSDTTTGRWQIFIQRRTQAHITPDQAVQLALGLAPELARQRLEAGLPLGESAQVSLTPYWWPRIPLVPFRITVDIRP